MIEYVEISEKTFNFQMMKNNTGQLFAGLLL